MSSFKLNATPFVFKTSKQVVNYDQPKKAGLSAMISNLESLNNDINISTPYVHKFRTEMCKNFEKTGHCKFGNEVSCSNKIF